MVEELYHNRARTDKDILIGMYLYRKEYTGFLDENSRITPALFFQPHFANIIYSLKVDEKNRAVLYSEVAETLRTLSIFKGFKYIKSFTPMRRFTTSHGGTVRYMDIMAAKANDERGEDGKATVVTDAVSERVLNRSFMVDRQERIYRDSIVVRFEDGKLNPTATFTALAAFLDIPYTESMTRCTDGGKEAYTPGNAVGFDPVSVYKTYDEYVNDSERIYIEYLLRDAYRYYGYDFHYYDGKPMDESQVKELVQGFDTINGLIRKTWKLVFSAVKVTHDGQESGTLEESIQAQMLEQYMEDVMETRLNLTEILMSNLLFVGKNGQPLQMMPMLEPDPALLDQPLYH